MIDTKLGFTRFPEDRKVQANYWPKIAKLPIAREEDVKAGSMIYPLRSALLSSTGPNVDLVLLTLPDQFIHDYREGVTPPFYTRHQLGSILLSEIPAVLTTRTMITDDNLIRGSVPGIEALGSIAHVRLQGKNERALSDSAPINELNSAKRDDAVDMMNQQWLLNYVMEAGITGNRVMPFTRLVGAFIGFHLPYLKPQQAHPWL
jgi:hypothetical protein